MNTALPPDPILSVIDRHRFADARWQQLQAEARDAVPGCERKTALAEAQWNVTINACHNLFLTPTATRAGAMALLRYVAELESAGDEILLLDALPGPHRRASVALCHRLIEGLE